MEHDTNAESRRQQSDQVVRQPKPGAPEPAQQQPAQTPTPQPANEGVPASPENNEGADGARNATPITSDTSERWLWIDPLGNDERLKSGSVLLDDVIKEYVRRGLLIEENTFDEGKLKGGSYTMTPAEDDAWMFLPGEKPRQSDRKVKLEKARDHQGEYYIVPRNSLVYIKLKQKLRLPFYIIGRHNLKIRYVYKGLLLGTGPQVDPGFEGNLFIPLHNFTTSEVKVHIGQSFVSIDFVRTTRFIDEREGSVQTVADLRKQLAGKRRLFEELKVRRQSLEDYLEGSTPRSQMAQFQEEFEAIKDKVEKQIQDAKKWAGVERLAVVFVVCGVIVALLNFFRGFVADLKTEMKDLRTGAAATNVLVIDGRIASFESRAAQALNLLSNQLNSQISSALVGQSALASNILQMESRLKHFESKDRQQAPGTNPTGSGSSPAAKP